MKNNRKRNILGVVAFVAILSVLSLTLGVCIFAITHRTIAFDTLGKSVPPVVVSAKQAETYVANELLQETKLAKYDLTIGAVEMKITNNHEGEIIVTFVENKKRNSKVIYAHLNTMERVFYGFEDYGKESKLYPGIIHFQDWSIDSTDAVRIVEEFFSTTADFRYDEIWLYTYNNYWGSPEDIDEGWNVFLIDKQNNIRYSAKISCITNEVSMHTKEYL